MLRVVGPPGTGKTAYLRQQVEAWSGQYDPRDMVLTSFTRAAARVLTGRVAVPAGNIATLHALCYRHMGPLPIAETGALAKEWDESGIPTAWRIGEGGEEIDPEERVLYDEPAGTMLADLNLWRAWGRPPHPLEEKTRAFASAWHEYKISHGAVDFADMLDYGIECMDAAPGEPGVLMVDEAQDLTAVQWALVNQWGGAAERYVVAGDGAQCLYSWAGASPEPLLTPLPPERHRLLGISYRLPAAVQAHAEAWLARHSPPMTEGREYQPREGRGTVRRLAASIQEPALLLRDIERQITAGRICMVLATCRYMLAPIIAVLRQAGIPYHNPYRRTNGAWNPLGARHGVSTLDRALDYLRPDPATWGAESHWWTDEELRRWLMMLRAEHIAGKKRAAAADAVGERALDYLADPLPAVAHDVTWLAQSVTKQYARPLEFIAAIKARRGGAVLRETPRVVVGTVHSVKGAEAEIVYLFPDLSLAAWRDSVETRAGRDAMIRTGYVGMTRAREELVLCEPVNARRAMWV